MNSNSTITSPTSHTSYKPNYSVSIQFSSTQYLDEVTPHCLTSTHRHSILPHPKHQQLNHCQEQGAHFSNQKNIKTISSQSIRIPTKNSKRLPNSNLKTPIKMTSSDRVFECIIKPTHSQPLMKPEHSENCIRKICIVKHWQDKKCVLHVHLRRGKSRNDSKRTSCSPRSFPRNRAGSCTRAYRVVCTPCPSNCVFPVSGVS